MLALTCLCLFSASGVIDNIIGSKGERLRRAAPVLYCSRVPGSAIDGTTLEINTVTIFSIKIVFFAYV